MGADDVQGFGHGAARVRGKKLADHMAPQVRCFKSMRCHLRPPQLQPVAHLARVYQP